MKEREQNLLIVATEIVGDFKSFGPVLQKSEADDYDLQSSIGRLIASLSEYKREEFTCETIDRERLLRHAKSSLVGIERTLDLCNVPEHEKREVMQRVYAYASYSSQVDEPGQPEEKTHLENGKVVFAKDRKKIKESEVLESIKMCIDALDLDGLAKLYNSLYDDENITGDDIIPHGDEWEDDLK